MSATKRPLIYALNTRPPGLLEPVVATLLARFLFANIKGEGWCPSKQASARVQCRKECEGRLNEVSIHGVKAGTN